MQFKISKELLEQIEQLIHSKNDQELIALLNDLHHADIAEIFDELDIEEATYIFKILDSEITAEILPELEEDVREKILHGLSAKEIAEELDELDTDDAADIIAELSQSKKEEVISELEDVEHAKDIVDLLRYDEDTAGGLMGKELVKVNENWLFSVSSVFFINSPISNAKLRSVSTGTLEFSGSCIPSSINTSFATSSASVRSVP